MAFPEYLELKDCLATTVQLDLKDDPVRREIMASTALSARKDFV